MSIAKASISQEEYLAGELVSDIKHELIDGRVYAMAGASKNHQRICANVAAEFRQHLKGGPCEAFSSDIKVNVGSNFYYPDVLVVCDDDDSEPYYTQTPVIIVEVLSPSTSREDRTSKRLAYINIPTLEEYVLIEQDFVSVEVLRKSADWQGKHYVLGDTITFESIHLSLSVEALYERVKNPDMVEWLQSHG